MVIMDMRNISSITDFFIVASGGSAVHLRAIGDIIEETLNKKGRKVWHIEGYNEAKWIVLDYGDVIVHLFQPDVRKFYDLERLWGDAPRIV